MPYIGVPNLKEIDQWEGYLQSAQRYFCKTVQRRSKWGNFQEHRSHELLGRFLSNLVCKVEYMEGIKYVNLIEICPVIIEIRGAENSELAVPVNNTLVHHTAFLAADTRPCLISNFGTQEFKSVKT